MAKLLKLRRGTTSQHGSFTGAEGEVTVDTDKETLVIHNGSTAGGFPLLRASGGSQAISTSGSITTTGNLTTNGDLTIESANPILYFNDTGANPDYHIKNNNGFFDIVDGTNSATRLSIGSTSVNIDGNTNFGNGIDVTGQITSTGALTITNEAPAIALVDSGQNPDWEVTNTGGTFIIKDSTANATKLYIESDGSTNIVGNLDAEAGLDVTGNITVTGTVDGADVAAMNSKLSGIESGATADQTKSDIDALNINADQVDSLHASSFVRSDADDSVSGNLQFAAQQNFNNSGDYPVVIGNANGDNNAKLLIRGSVSPYIQFREDNTDKAYLQWHSDGFFRIGNSEDSSQLRIKDDITFSLDGNTHHKVWHAGNDGAG